VGHDLTELSGVQFFFPAADDDGGRAIADGFGEGAAFAHEFINADYELEDGGESDEASAGDSGSA